jgi:two-component system nitrogen regulation response regulator NtrX
MAPGDVITEHDLAFLSGAAVSGPVSDDVAAPAVPLYTARDQFEREYILRQLAIQQGNISRTAEVLGVERSNLYRKMRAFGIAPNRRADAADDTEEEAV